MTMVLSGERPMVDVPSGMDQTEPDTGPEVARSRISEDERDGTLKTDVAPASSYRGGAGRRAGRFCGDGARSVMIASMRGLRCGTRLSSTNSTVILSSTVNWRLDATWKSHNSICRASPPAQASTCAKSFGFSLTV